MKKRKQVAEKITRHGDTGIKKNRNIKIDIVDGQPRAYNIATTPIHTYHARGFLTQEQFMAGDELYQAFYIAMLGLLGCPTSRPGVVSFNPTSFTPMTKATEQHNNSYAKFCRGMNALKHKDDKLLVYNVCCQEVAVNALFSSERAVRHGKIRLRDCLQIIAEEYGLLSRR